MRLGSVALGGSVREHQCGCQGSAAGQQRGKAGHRGSSAGRSGCASSSVVIEAAAAFIQLQWPLRWIAASAAESAALAAGAKLLAVLMGGAPEDPTHLSWFKRHLQRPEGPKKRQQAPLVAWVWVLGVATAVHRRRSQKSYILTKSGRFSTSGRSTPKFHSF